MFFAPFYEMICAILYYFYNFKNVKNCLGGVLILGELLTETCTFTKSKTSMVFFSRFMVQKGKLVPDLFLFFKKALHEVKASDWDI